MSRLDDIVQGTRAIKRVKFPLVNCPSDLTELSAELKEARAADIAAAKASAATYPTHAEIGLRVLLPGEFAAVLERVLAFCKERGEDKPDADSSPIYNLGMQIYTLAAAAVDPDQPRNVDGSDRLFFGNSVEDAARKIQSCVHMTRDTLAYLSQIWEGWCEHCNPQASKVDYWAIIEGAAKSADFLENLRPGLLFSCMHIMAAQLASLPQAKLQYTEPSPTTPTRGKTNTRARTR